MRHKLKRDKLSRTSPHRRSMLANIASSLVEHEQIKTTLPKAKLLRPYIEKVITLGKGGSLASRRLAISRLRDKNAVRKVFSELATRYKTRPGGYCRILRCGFRAGDTAPMAFIELVDRNPEAKGAAQKKLLEEKKAADSK